MKYSRYLIIPPPPLSSLQKKQADIDAYEYGDAFIKDNIFLGRDLEKWLDRKDGGKEVSKDAPYNKFPIAWKRYVFQQIGRRLEAEARRGREICEAEFKIQKYGFCHSTHISHGITLLYIAGGLEEFTIPPHIESISKTCADPNSNLRELTLTSKLSKSYYNAALPTPLSPMELLANMPNLKKIKFAGKPYALEKLPYFDEAGPVIRLTNLYGADITFYRLAPRGQSDPTTFIQVDKTGGGAVFSHDKFSRNMRFDYSWALDEYLAASEITEEQKELIRIEKEFLLPSAAEKTYFRKSAAASISVPAFDISKAVKEVVSDTKKALLFGKKDFVASTNFIHVSDHCHLENVLRDLVDWDSLKDKWSDWRDWYMCFRIFRSIALQTGRFDSELCETWPKDDKNARMLKPDQIRMGLMDYLFFQEAPYEYSRRLGGGAGLFKEMTAWHRNRNALFAESSVRGGSRERANLKKFLGNNSR